MAFDNTNEFDSIYLGKRISSIKLFNINEYFLILDVQKKAIIDGGIEIDFEGNKLVIGWNVALELFDSTNDSFKSLIHDLAHFEINSKELAIGKNLVGAKLSGLKTNWNWFQDFEDETDENPKKHFILHEIIFTFEDGRTLQLATINFTVENGKIVDANFDSQGELLISVDEIIDIEA